MISLGVNSVLFKAYSFAEAAKAIALAGYDGVEISAIQGMCEHLVLGDYKAQKAELLGIMEENGLKFLSTEVASLELERLKKAFEAAADLGIPVVNVGPGGKSDVPEDLENSLDTLYARAELAKEYGVTLCCKAHVGSAIYNTPTTLKLMERIQLDSFGVDMDPSHIYRAGEKPEEALPSVISRVKHIHIRDCKGPGPNPGLPAHAGLRQRRHQSDGLFQSHGRRQIRWAGLPGSYRAGAHHDRGRHCGRRKLWIYERLPEISGCPLSL